MPIVLQLSDLHLGRLPEHEAQRCAIVADVVREEAPDLVVVSGDLCDDAPCQPEQITKFGKTLVDALDAPVQVVPGNHDIGNKPGIENDALTAERYDAWRAVFGNGWFRHDLHGTVTDTGTDHWAVLGLNSQILGSGFDAEAEQDDWLDEQLASCERAVVFMHMPPDLPALVDARDEQRQGLTYWPVNPGPREALLDRLSSARVKLLCSGHLHNDAALPHALPPRRWCPSLSFGVVIPGVTGVVSRGDRIGVLRHELRDDDVVSTLLPVDLPVTKTMTI